MLNQALIPEFKHEMASTRKMLERVPFDKWSWKPHEKSMTLGRLCDHVATLPEWMTVTLTTDEFDFAKDKLNMPSASSKENLLGNFDHCYKNALQHLEAADDDLLRGTWVLKNNGHVILSLPRTASLRSFVMNHLIHHRGQLSVYLRLLDVPLPGMYGPSADEV